MADINSYALSIELTLQSNAEQVLAGVVGQIGVVEARVQNMVQNLGNSLNQFSTQLTQNMGKLSSAVSTMGQNVNSINLAAPVQGMAAATIQAQQAVQNLSNQFQLPVDLVNKLRDAMIAVSVVDWKEDENVGEVIKQYQYLTNTALPGLQKIREHIAGQGKTLSAEEVRLAQQIGDMQMQVLRSKQVLENQYHRLRTKWFTMTKAQFKDEILSQKEINKLTKEQLDTYRELIVVGRARARTQEAITDPTQQVAANKETQKFGAVLGGLPSSVDKIGDKFKVLKGIISDVGAVIGKTLSTVGLGPIVQAASATGLYATGVKRAAEREEELHQISLRSLGSMESLSATIRQTSSETGLLTSELTTSSIALRDAGFSSAKQVKEMSQYTGMLVRTTGASVDITAKFAKTLAVVGKNEAFATKQIFLMQRAAKFAGLSGSDLNVIMGRVSENAQLMGTHGPTYTEKFTKSLINSANAAKKLGLNVNDAIAITERMQDPLESVGLLGREAFDIWTDPEEMQQRLAEVAKQHLAHIDAISSGAQKWRSIQRVGALMGMEGAPAAAVLKNLRFLALGSDDVANTLGDVKDPAEEMQNALKETSTIMRDVAKTIEQTFNRIEARLAGVKGWFGEIFEWTSKSGAAFGEWGTYAGAAIGSAMSLFGTFLQFRVATAVLSKLGISLTSLIPGGKLVTTAMQGLWGSISNMGPTAIRGLSGSISSMVSSAIPALTSLSGIVGLLGSAAAVAAAAFVGWKVGRLIDEWTGFGDSIDKVNKGTGTWWDYAKTFSNPVGWMCVGLNKLTKAWNDYWYSAGEKKAIESRKKHMINESKELQDLAAKYEQSHGDPKLYAELMQARHAAQLSTIADSKETLGYHAEFNKAVQGNNLALAKQFAIEEKRAKLGDAFNKDAGKFEADAMVEAEKAINDAIAKRIKQMNEAIELKRKEVEQTEVIESIKRIGHADHQKAAEKAKQAADEELRKYDKLTGLKIKLPSKNETTQHLAKVEAEFAKLTAEMSKEEKAIMMPDVSAAINDVAKATPKEPAPIPVQDIAKATQKALDGSKMVTTEDVKPHKVQPKSESIIPVKHTDQTARPIEKEDTVSPAVAKTNQLIEGIIRKIGESKLGEVVKILEDNLPKLVEASNPGLAPAANQWIN